jgi:hypothetical protein
MPMAGARDTATTRSGPSGLPVPGVATEFSPGAGSCCSETPPDESRRKPAGAACPLPASPHSSSRHGRRTGPCGYRRPARPPDALGRRRPPGCAGRTRFKTPEASRSPPSGPSTTTCASAHSVFGPSRRPATQRSQDRRHHAGRRSPTLARGCPRRPRPTGAGHLEGRLHDANRRPSHAGRARPAAHRGGRGARVSVAEVVRRAIARQQS